METNKLAAPAPADAGPGAARPGLPVVSDPMEQALLATMPVTDSDLQTLASDRAKAVRTCIILTGKVEPERLFLTESQSGGVKTDGARAYLQLR
jgi:hypothetical protein